MMSVGFGREAVGVTGSSGFVGRHLCTLLRSNGLDVQGLDIRSPRAGWDWTHCDVDIRRPFAGGSASGSRTLIHLAAEAESVPSFEKSGQLVDVNLKGTIHVIEAFKPRLLLFASSSAVYGNGSLSGIKPAWSSVNPVGLYGMSKAASELVCSDWARVSAGAAVGFRFGNVTGKRCRGFIPALVAHARRYPNGAVPIQCRGEGRIVRDLVPVTYVTRILEAAIQMPWKPGSYEAFNVGTGRPLTNGEVGAAVARRLKQRGYRLNCNWNNPISACESQCIVLDVRKTVRKFGLELSTHEEVEQAIEEAVDSYLDCGDGPAK